MSKTKLNFNVTLAEIQQARQVLNDYLQPSPLLKNTWLSEALNCEIYLKLENMHPIGSFKLRGATYKISRLSPAEKKRGVIAASAGNHAQGVAWASQKLGVDALIVMPINAPLVKIQNTKALGAKIVLEGETFDQAFSVAKKIAKKSGRNFIHAFEDPEIIAGQGTVGLEIIEQLADADFVVSSMGGGGLMTGISIVLKSLRPQTQLVGCQAQGASSLVQSIRRKKAIRLERVSTFADGIAIRQASEKIRKLLHSRLDFLLEEDDEAIATAVLTLLEKAKIVAEGSGALPLAVLDQIRGKIKNKKVVLVVSGGNIDVNVLTRIVDRGLLQAGRRIRLNVLLSDRPGSLNRLTETIAKNEASVLQAIHDRNDLSVAIDQTEVALTLETRGPQHSAEVLRAIGKQVIRMEIAR